MTIVDIIKLLGGLGLFLFGMHILGDGLESSSGGKLEKILEKLTGNIFVAVLLGAVVTALIQSSSATTVIVVGLINAKTLKLKNAIGVIMGANIGTTVTAQLLSLADLESSNIVIQMLKPATLAPLAAFVGIVIFMLAKRNSKKVIGSILLGFGILFQGMFAMEAAVAPLKDSPQLSELFATISNPILGVLVGAGVTAIIQSSSASVGILQALSSTGAITFSSAFPIIMGQNIGTCITPIMASIGASKNAKRSAIIHLSFNILGSIVFLIAVYTIKEFITIPFWNDVVDKSMIANTHTIFNISVTLIFLPFIGLLEKLACLIIRDKDKVITKNKEEEVTLEERLLSSPVLAIEQGRKAVVAVSQIAQSMMKTSIGLTRNYDRKIFDRIKEDKNTIGKIDDKLATYLLAISQHELSLAHSQAVTELLQSMSEIRQMAHCIEEVAEISQEMYDKKISFSESALSELDIMEAAVTEILDMSTDMLTTGTAKYVAAIESLEDVIDSLEAHLKERHVERLREQICSPDTAINFISVLSQYETISDNCSNLGVLALAYDKTSTKVNRHKFSKKIHSGDIEGYTRLVQEYREKYMSQIIG